MCGIIYAKNLTGNEPVNNLIKVLYQNQKSRGQQGFGFVGMSAKSINTYRSINEKWIMRYLNENQYDEILFHHRNPTSTPNTLKSTHPFVIQLNGKSYYFVHNGIIQNDDELQKDHYERNIAYESHDEFFFNDSEALAWDFCLWLNGEQDKMKARGAVAFICLETDEKNRASKLYFYRNTEVPLRIYRDKTLFIISSEGNYPLIKENSLYCWDYPSGQVLKMGGLKIDCPNVYDVSMDDGTPDYEIMLCDELRALEQERDYLISVGNYEEAGYIDDDIMDLADQLKGRTLTQF